MLRDVSGIEMDLFSFVRINGLGRVWCKLVGDAYRRRYLIHIVMHERVMI